MCKANNLRLNGWMKIAFFLCFSSLTAAQFHTIDTTSPALCTFSSRYQNRIMVDQGKIKKVITADDEKLSIYMEDLSGQAFICVRDPRLEETALSVITETGVVQDLQVAFIDRSSEVLVLTDPTVEIEELQAENTQNSSDNGALAKINEILIGHIPDGYLSCPVTCSPWKLKKGLTLDPLAQLENAEEVLYLYQVTNTTKKRKTLTECELRLPSCRWVFLESHDLLPKQRVLAIISVRQTNG